MIRVVRVKEVLSLEEGGEMQAVLELQNQAGMSVELPVSVEQMAIVVRLNKADHNDAPAPQTAPTSPAPPMPVELPVDQTAPVDPLPPPVLEFTPPGPPPHVVGWEVGDEPDVPGELTGVEQF